MAEGAFIGLGRTGQSVRVGFLRPGIYDPSNPVWEFSNKPLTSGNRYNIYITTQKTSTDDLERLRMVVDGKTAATPSDAPMTNDMIDDNLHLSGMFYFSTVDTFSDYASKSLGVVSTSHVSMGYICNEVKPVWEYLLWWPLYVKRIDRGGAHIDVVRNVKCAVSVTGNTSDKVS